MVKRSVVTTCLSQGHFSVEIKGDVDAQSKKKKKRKPPIKV